MSVLVAVQSYNTIESYRDSCTVLASACIVNLEVIFFQENECFEKDIRVSQLKLLHINREKR